MGDHGRHRRDYGYGRSLPDFLPLARPRNWLMEKSLSSQDIAGPHWNLRQLELKGDYRLGIDHEKHSKCIMLSRVRMCTRICTSWNLFITWSGGRATSRMFPLQTWQPRKNRGSWVYVTTSACAVAQCESILAIGIASQITSCIWHSAA